MCVKISYEISGWVRLGNAVHIQVLMFKLFSNLFVKSPNWPGSNKMEKKKKKGYLQLFWENLMLL